MNEKSLICVPGQRLCLSDKTHVTGHGTYERQGYIYSTLAGVVDVVDKDGVCYILIVLFTFLLVISYCFR